MDEKFNKNAKVEKNTSMLGIAVRLIVIDPFTLWVTQFNFALSDENRKYSHMIDYHVILRAIY